MTPYVSVVVPVYNEAENLEALFLRLIEVLDGLAKPYEILFTNDGSRDRSGAILHDFHRRRPDRVRVIEFNRNFGQHLAIIAAFERVRGEVIVTLDADLQNPPEEIPKLLAAIEAGHDVVGSYRRERHDIRFRRYLSKLINFVRERTTRIHMRDQGCMLRAYRRRIVDQIATSGEVSIFIPVLAASLAGNPTEIEVAHARRAAGRSKYGIYQLARLNFDLMTGFSLIPLQAFTMFGVVTSFISGLFVVYLFMRRLIVGPEAEGVFTLFAILYLLVALGILGLGIIGEYVGRIYLEVRRRPRFVVRGILEQKPNEPAVLVFAYHDVGYECLDELITRGANVVAVISHEHDPAEEVWFRSVSELARRYGIPVHTPESVNAPEWIDRIRAFGPDLIFSFYYRHLICREILSMPRLGAFNAHGSLLPKYRGRAPINWAIVQGETKTGATLHRMIAKPDAGDIVDQEAVPIAPLDTAHDVFAKVALAARKVLARQWENLRLGTAPSVAQNEYRATYFGRRKPEDGRIDWSQSAQSIFNLVRAVTHPYPGAFTDANGRRLLVWWALPRANAQGLPGEVLSVSPLTIATGQGGLEIIRLQWTGEPETNSSQDRHGLHPGDVLGASQRAQVAAIESALTARST